MTTTAQLPPEVLAQLLAFARQEGRRWKNVLAMEYWMRGLPVPGFPLLYGLRNHPAYGPEWLHNLKLPVHKTEAIAVSEP